MKFFTLSIVLAFATISTNVQAFTYHDTSPDDIISILNDQNIRNILRATGEIRTIQRSGGYYYLHSGRCMISISVVRENNFGEPSVYNSPVVNILKVDCN